MQFPQNNIPINKSTYLIGVFLILFLIIGGLVFVTIQRDIAKKSYEKRELKNEKAKEISNQPQEDSDKSFNTECGCSDFDAEQLVNRFIRDFDIQQLDIESNNAKSIKLDNIDKKSNCIWKATFKIYSWYEPDDAHYITKRIVCHGKTVYIE